MGVSPRPGYDPSLPYLPLNSRYSPRSASQLPTKTERRYRPWLFAVLGLGVLSLLSLHPSSPSLSTFRDDISCMGWDHSAHEGLDPEGCARARRYRQVTRALEREQSDDNLCHGWDKDRVVANLQQVQRCYLPKGHANATSCHDRPIIVSSYWWTAMALGGVTSGEAIWQSSLIDMAEELGYHVLPMDGYEKWIQFAESIPDVLHSVWGGDGGTTTCLTDPRCVAEEHYRPLNGGKDLLADVPEEERGTIPIFRLISMDYWGAKPKNVSNNAYYWGITEDGEWSYHVLGQEWIATPWPLPDKHIYLPYTIEKHCALGQVTPWAERHDCVLILAKKSSFFHDGRAPPEDSWATLANGDFDFVSVAQVEEGKDIPEGITNLGFQTREDYNELVGSSKALLGIGWPAISPSVYTALCHGTPVIMPYYRENPDFSGWNLYTDQFQHGPASAIGPPYVYSYFKEDLGSLQSALEQAVATPIGRYIPHDMKHENALKTFKRFLQRDQEKMFQTVVRKNDGRVPQLAKHIKDACVATGICPKMMDAGRPRGHRV